MRIEGVNLCKASTGELWRGWWDLGPILGEDTDVDMSMHNEHSVNNGTEES